MAFLGGEDGLLVKWDKTIPLTDVLQTEEFQEIDNQIHVYPNPAQDFVTVEFPEMHKINTITLTDLAGTEIQKFDTFNNTMTIDLSKFPSGIYLIYIYTKDREIVRRIIKTPN